MGNDNRQFDCLGCLFLHSVHNWSSGSRLIFKNAGISRKIFWAFECNFLALPHFSVVIRYTWGYFFYSEGELLSLLLLFYETKNVDLKLLKKLMGEHMNEYM